jgi:hypothetical protein
MLKDDCVTKIYGQSTVGDEVGFILWESGTSFCCIQTLLGIKAAKQQHILTDKQTNFDNLKNTYNENLASQNFTSRRSGLSAS